MAKKLWLYELCVDIAYCFINIYKRITSNHIMIGRSAHVGFNSKLGGYNKIERNSTVSGVLGKCTYVGSDSLVVGKVGNYCSIGGNVFFLVSTHPTRNWVSSHPAFYSTKKQCGISFVNYTRFNEYPTNKEAQFSIEIGNDVYIGFGSILIAPLRIGNGAIIGAGSVVTKDVPSYAVVAGNPAEVIRYRFDKETIERIEASKWWDKDFEWLRKHAEYFNDKERFLETLND